MSIKPVALAAILSALVLSAPVSRGQAQPAPANASNPAPAAPTYSPEDEADARIALGDRFADMAESLARTTQFSKQGLTQAAILLEAAVQMSPGEPRYLRRLADWREQLGDTGAAISTWTKYRGLLPDDLVAQAKLIDLYLLRLQSNDQKVKYLKGLVGKATLDEQLKAYVASRAVPLIDQRSRSQALEMLAQARQFYPLPEVTLMEWQMLPADASPMQKLQAMLNVLRANPTNPEALAGVCDMLAANGLSERALTWYGVLMDVHAINGTAPPEASVINFLSERYRAGETTVANDRLDTILQRYPDDVQTWFLRLTTQRGDESPQMISQAQQVFIKHLLDVCQNLTPGSAATDAAAPATTQPSGISPQQIKAAIAKAQTGANQQVRDLLVDALANLSWFELYYDHRADLAAPALDGLKALLPADNFLRRRLEGWSRLTAKDYAGAQAILTPQQDVDPLAALGLFVIADTTNHPEQSAAIGGKIMSDPRTGVEAAILFQATKGKGIKATKEPPDAKAIAAELDKFPKEWLDAVHNPAKFYSLRIEPVKVGHRLGEPMLAQITIQNESKMDLTIGDYGLIRPTVVLDGYIRGVNAQAFPLIATDRLMGRMVLKPEESLTQIVRVDQAALSEALRLRPAILVLLNGDVILNPFVEGQAARPHAGGYGRNFNKMFTRNPAQLSADASRRKLFDDMTNGTPVSKILDIELLAAYYNQYLQPNATESELTFAQQYLSFIEKSRSDPAPGVKLWASYTYAVLLAGDAERRTLTEMLASTSWEARLLALVASHNQPVDFVKPIATHLAASDPDVLVKAYAAGLAQFMQASPTTAPSAASRVGPAAVAPTPGARPAGYPPATRPAVPRAVGPAGAPKPAPPRVIAPATRPANVPASTLPRTALPTTRAAGAAATGMAPAAARVTAPATTRPTTRPTGLLPTARPAGPATRPSAQAPARAPATQRSVAASTTVASPRMSAAATTRPAASVALFPTPAQPSRTNASPTTRPSSPVTQPAVSASASSKKSDTLTRATAAPATQPSRPVAMRPAPFPPLLRAAAATTRPTSPTTQPAVATDAF